MFFINSMIYNLLIAFGVIIGASVFAGIGAIINNQAPLKTMFNIASSVKIWAVAVALGGTFSSFQVIEQGLFKGEIKSVIRQVAYIIAAVVGANLGSSFIQLIKRCGEEWMK